MAQTSCCFRVIIFCIDSLDIFWTFSQPNPRPLTPQLDCSVFGFTPIWTAPFSVNSSNPIKLSLELIPDPVSQLIASSESEQGSGFGGCREGKTSLVKGFVLPCPVIISVKYTPSEWSTLLLSTLSTLLLTVFVRKWEYKYCMASSLCFVEQS